MMWYRPENTNNDRGEAEVNIGIPGKYHTISNASLVNNCFIYITFRERYTGIIAPGKILNLYTSFGTVKHLAETVQNWIRPPFYYFIYVVHKCHHSTFTNNNSYTPCL